MRLDILETGHKPPARLFIKTVQTISRRPMDPVAKIAMHRPEFFGGPFLALVAATLRGPSFWTVAEREHFATFTSSLNECPFCVQVHAEASRIEAHGAASTDGMRPEVTAVLELLENVTRQGGEISDDDITAVREHGVPDDAIVDALHVNLVFNTINRLANAFGLEWESEEHARLAARVLHVIKYRMPPFAMR